MKRIITCILALFLCLYCLDGFCAAGSADEKQAGTGRAGAVLAWIGVLDGDTADEAYLNQTVTRAEFVKIYNRLNGIVPNTTEARFSDVGPEHWAVAEINAAVDAGAVTGCGDGTFCPDEPITYIQALKMLINLIGFGRTADFHGGYPAGYLYAAKLADIGFTMADTQSTLTREQMILLVFDAVSGKVMEPVVFRGDETEYQIIKNETYLSRNFQIYKLQGLLYANSDTSLGGGLGPDGKLILQIGKESVLLDDPRNLGNEFLGMEVEAYYQREETAGRDTVCYLAAGSQNQVIEISDMDFQDYADGVLSYYSNGSARRVQLPVGTPLVYNGKLIEDREDYSPELFQINSGTICVIKNSSGTVVRITNYVNYVVHSVDREKQRIYDKYSQGKYLELSRDGGREKQRLVDASGGEVMLEQINEWDVVSAAVSKGEREAVVKLVVSPHAVRGKITEILDDGTEIRIENERFRLTREFQEYARQRKNILRLGEAGVFYLDFNGNIAAVDREGTRDNQYGYVVGLQTEAGFQDQYYIKLLTEENQVEVFSFADRVSVNGERQRGNARITPLTGGKEARSVRRQLITYQTDEQGAISRYQTAKELDAPDTADGDLIYNFKPSVDLKYKRTVKTFEGRVNINDQTKVFIVPTEEAASAFEDEDYAVRSASYFKDNAKYQIHGYSTIKHALVQEAVVYYVGERSAVGINADNPVTLVEELVTALDSDGIAVPAIVGMTSGKRETVLVNSRCELPEITSGDIIRCELDNTGCADLVELVFDYETRSVTAGRGGYDNLFYAVYGQVYRREDGVIALRYINESGEEILENQTVSSSSSICVYDSEIKNERIKVGTVEDIKDFLTLGENASRVFVHSRYSEPETTIIYR